MDAAELKGVILRRRSALKRGGATAFLISQAVLFERIGSAPKRPSPATAAFPDIQFDLGAFIRPAQVFNDGAGNVTAQFAARLHAVPAGQADPHPDEPTRSRWPRR